MDYDFQFTSAEKEELASALSTLPPNPYTDYEAFMAETRALASSGRVPPRFVEFCGSSSSRDFSSDPVLVIGNCPIDPDLPVFDSREPVTSKYALKKTFISEGFLAIYAVLTGTEIIAHKSVNSGDFFHDIYPKESMYDSQSQKTLETLRFHRDFTNHFVSPDFVVTLTLRDTPENEVYSTFAINSQVIRQLPDGVRRTLMEEQFYTPYDDVSTIDGATELGRARNHAVITPAMGIRVFEGRTVGLTPDAQAALDQLIAALHASKIRRVGQPGDCVSFSNAHVIHGREVEQLRDIESLKRRWLMKTHNVKSLQAFEQYFLQERYGVVNG